MQLNIAKVLSLNKRIVATYGKLSLLTSKEETMSSLEFMDITNDMKNLADLEDVYKNIVHEEKKESEYEWIYSEPVLI